MYQIDAPALLTTAYFPNIQYFSKILTHKSSIIEVHETYQKQSFRNRCRIYASEGAIDLTVPVIKINGNRTITRDIIIEYEMNWQMIHWRAISSAYGHSPFFEIFEEEFRPLFEKKVKYLIDLNQKILTQLLDSIGTIAEVQFSENFQRYDENPFDYRKKIHPKEQYKEPDKTFELNLYNQVFSDKCGFIPNLSFIDLIFNEGPQAISLCSKSYIPIK